MTLIGRVAPVRIGAAAMNSLTGALDRALA